MIANTARIDHLLQPIVAKHGIKAINNGEVGMQIGIARERCSSNENNSAKHLRHLRKASACNTK